MKPEMDLSELRSDITTLENSQSLFEETNFVSRFEAIDYLDFHVIERIDQLLLEPDPQQELAVLKQKAKSLKSRLEEIDLNLFLRIRSDIKSGICTGLAFKNEINKFLDTSTVTPEKEIGYDCLDLLINGILPPQNIPEETKAREPEMVYYQKTPARIIFELVDRAKFLGKDVFYDLGSGLGQVCTLVNLLSGARSVGVEFEPGFCNYARACTCELNLKNVDFINEDARLARYSDGTVFFMYTPFTGRLLQDVLELLRHESQVKMIRIFTFGPCTTQVSQQSWLKPEGHNSYDINKLCEFRSI